MGQWDFCYFVHIFSFAIRPIEAVEKLTDSFSVGRVLWGPLLEVITREIRGQE